MHEITTSIQTMTSTDLLEIINSVRAEHGEKPIRANDFIDRVADELDDDHYEKFVVQNSNKTTSVVAKLTQDQCMLVSMRESKAVRRSVLARLNAAIRHPAPAKVEPPVAALVDLARLTLESLPNLGENSKQSLLSVVTTAALGVQVIPLPVVTEHHMTATEVGEKLGISSAMVGRLANKHGIKVAAYGETRLDKSRHSAKQVESFVYNTAGLERLREILEFNT